MNEKLMAYLYGELSAEARVAFEAELADNEALQQEYEELTSTRSMLRQLEDVSPKPTVVELKTTPRFRWRELRWMSVAAAVALLLLVGKPRVDFGKNGLSIAFGTPPNQPTMNAAPTTVLTAEDYEAITRELMAQDQQLMNRRLDSIQQLLGSSSTFDDAFLATAIERQLARYQYQQNQQQASVITTNYEQTVPRIVSNVQDMQLEQRREIRRLLNQMWQQVQRQRESDLQAIEAAIFRLEQQQLQLNQQQLVEQ